MKIKGVYIFFLIFFALSCQPQDKKTNESKIAKGKFPVIIDTSSFKVSEIKASSMSVANYHLLYIGLPKDTILINYDLRYLESLMGITSPDLSFINEKEILYKPVFNDYHIGWPERGVFRTFFDSASIDISLDTNTFVKMEIEPMLITNAYFKAYPVLLSNNSRDTIELTYGDFIPLIIEAKDKMGVWKPIEEQFRCRCGNLGSVILPPKHVVLTSALIYHGDFKTDLRLKLGNNYSPVFKGEINYSQFGINLE